MYSVQAQVQGVPSLGEARADAFSRCIPVWK